MYIKYFSFWMLYYHFVFYLIKCDLRIFSFDMNMFTKDFYKYDYLVIPNEIDLHVCNFF